MPSMSHDDFLRLIRAHELESAIRCFPSSHDGAMRRTLLEIGAGTGQQAKMLASRGYEVTAIDLPSSHYHDQRVFHVVDYDGHSIPCATGSMDIVFSSNVLEHVSEIDSFLDETARVMKDNGVAIHILPTSSCRNWSLPAHYLWAARRLMALRPTKTPDPSKQGRPAPKRPSGMSQWMMTLFPPRHGERGTAFTESIYYSQYWWTKRFMAHGFSVERTQTNKLFYTMANALTDSLSISSRARLSRYLGSSCRIYVLRRMAIDRKATA